MIQIIEVEFKSGIPLYIQIKNYIREEIKSGTLKVGDKIPSEELLCEKFNVSRITVIRALRDLVTEGFIIRKQGKGSFVDKPNYEKDLSEFANFIHTSPSIKVEHKILKWHLVKPSKEVLDKVKTFKYSSILEIVRVGFHKGEAIALEYIYIPKNIRQYFKNKRKLFESKLVYDIYKTIPDIFLDNSRIFIKPVIADKAQAKTLGINIGDPLLLWERITFSKDKKIIEFSRFFARGDKCNYYLEYHK